MAHGLVPDVVQGRRLVAVFASPVATELTHLAAHVGYDVLIIEPDPNRVADERTVADVAHADLDASTDVVVTDHDRSELGDVLATVLAAHPRWVGVMGSPRVPAPHIPALADRGFTAEEIARVHRPIGLDIGSRSPAEIALSTVAGLLADRAGRTGGLYERQVSAAAEPSPHAATGPSGSGSRSG